MKLLVRCMCHCVKGCDGEELHPFPDCDRCNGTGEFFVNVENVITFNCVEEEEEHK